METSNIKQETKTIKEEGPFYSTCKLSIRRRDLEAGLPGDDPTAQTLKIGSALKGKAPLSGLSFEEERKYLPEIIQISPQDNEFRKQARDYWNNISEPIPHDDVSLNSKLPGRVVEFEVEFKTKKDKEEFDKALTFELKAEISKRGEISPKDIADYILFRYCLVYGKVSNNMKDRYKSNKIEFFLFSSEVNTKLAYNKFKLKDQARTLFSTLLSDNKMIDALMRLFKMNPEDSNLFTSIEDKHLALDNEISKNPALFLEYAKDKYLSQKAFVMKALEKGVIFNPPNTDLYYMGADQEVLLGKSLMETVHFLTSKEGKNVAIKDTIKAQMHV